MSRGGVEGSSIDPMEGSESNNSMCDLLREAFSATVARDYEKAVSVVRCAVATDYAFGVEDLELMDHVYACILNTSHYDESVIEVCWEWIDALERAPRLKDPRVVSSSQLSIYYAYHMISRVQERMPRRANHTQARADAWRRVKRSFDYLWSAAVQLWKPFELDRLDILCSWSYLALQFSDAVDEDTLELIETAKCQAAHVLATTIVVENAHQANQRVATVERNLKEAKALAEKLGKKFGAKEQAVTISLMSNEGEEEEGGVPAKRRKEDEE
ncbi:hypothetical protein V3C99_004993 [Haemonchus contortus]|uniref:Uncharacterized protein n=1 Tax=Haemonchus contortus TaxID=6289 RepID=A0A7I4XUP8_HAECO|nr:Hypothetical protein CBG08752 [Haemonchus contortus]